MALADTAKLAVDLSLTGNFTSGLSKAQSQLTGFNNATSRVAGGIGKIGSAASGAAGHVKNLVMSPLGLIGLGGAVFGLEHVLHGAVDNAEAFGEAVLKVGKITALTTEQTSALVDTLDYFGVTADAQTRIVGMAEKNLGALAGTTKNAKRFQKEYGLSLVDAKGKVKDFNTLLLASADYFNNKSIPASTKAAALAKIYGRNWQQLIPILAQGSAKLKAAEKDAIKLSPTDIKNMQDFKEASREWNDALQDLSITIGAKLLPYLTGLATTASKFVREHSADIVKFFQDAAAFAAKAGEVIGNTVIPTIQGLAGAAGKFWGSIPAPLRDLLVKGFIADRTVHFLFGVSPIKIAVDFAEAALGKVAGSIAGAIGGKVSEGLISAGIGHAFVQPVFVTNPGFGGGGGGGLPGGGGGGGEPGVGSAAGEGFSVIGAVKGLVKNVAIPAAAASIALLAINEIAKTGTTPASLAANQNAVNQQEAFKHNYGRSGPVPVMDTALTHATQLLDRGGRETGKHTAASLNKVRDGIESTKIATLSGDRKIAGSAMAAGVVARQGGLAAARAINAKKLSASVQVNVKNSVTVNSRGILHSTSTYSRYYGQTVVNQLRGNAG